MPHFESKHPDELIKNRTHLLSQKNIEIFYRCLTLLTPITMKPAAILLALVLLISSSLFAETPAPEPARLKELDAYWAEVSRSVQVGDFAAYVATCHPEAVLVTGSKKTTSPLATALQRWQRDFDETKAGKRISKVVFKFSQRLGDATTAHETGMFWYSGTAADGQAISDYIHLEALLVKRDGRWQILMEYQKSRGTREEFAAL
jgi:hypothetical protein